MARANRADLIITCEHASNRLPTRYGGLGLTKRALQTHVAWDRGARRVARYCARRLGGRYHEGRYSRLLVDLNRSLHNPKLIPKVSFGVPIPGNVGLMADERQERVQRYYEPYRAAVLHDIRSALDRGVICAHLSVHSFSPRLGLRIRQAEIGILYDPARARERVLALSLVDSLRAQGLLVRRNYPYRGTSDGFTTYCRRIFFKDVYLGIEVEFNQRLLGPHKSRPGLSRSLATGIEAALEKLTRSGV